MKLSTLIRNGADEFLKNGRRDDLRQGMQTLSCCAVWEACIRNGVSAASKAFDDLARQMGLDGCGDCFTGIRKGPQRQAARYAWLMFVADFADEEGIEV